jgi:hypothetical protein
METYINFISMFFFPEMNHHHDIIETDQNGSERRKSLHRKSKKEHPKSKI